MSTEAKSVAENLLSNFKFQTLSEEEIVAREAEQKARKLREKGNEYLAKANIPERHKGTKALEGEKWLRLHDRIVSRVGTGFIIALVGRRGTGKTQMGVSLAKHVARAGKRPLYATAMGFFIDIKESFRDKASSEKAVIEHYSTPALLVLDEMQERGETPWEDRLLTHLIDKRYQSQKDTLLLSNQTKEIFLSSIGESIASRIIETGGVAVCDWDSSRTA